MLSIPSVDGIRVATLEDLHRISVVAAAAFFWSPTFKFQRPHYGDYPADTINSYFREYEAAIKDPSCVVLVADDTLDTKEAEHVYEALRICGPQSLKKMDIVGVCSLNLKPKSSYVGRFNSPDQQVNATDGFGRGHDLKRDQCGDAVMVYDSITGPVKAK
jgi:hypothetical protein